MRVAFLSANREKLPDAVIPLGLLYVMGACPERHEKVLWDLCFEEDPLGFLATRIEEFEPDVVALGLRNIQNADYTGVETNLGYYRSVVETIRAHSGAWVVLGGGGFSVMPRELMLELGADFGIYGEGEQGFPRLLDALGAGGKGLGQVAALYHRDREGNLQHQPRGTEFLSFEALPPPDRTLVDPRYYERYGIDSLQTSRGCPLECTYCTYPRIEGAKGRVRDPVAVAEEFGRIPAVHPNVRHVFVVDSVFNLPVRQAKAVCRELIARGPVLPWTCYANPIGFDQELADLMAEAGCAGMEIGSDSGCDEVLARLRKGFDTAAIRRIRDLARGAAIKDCHTFILGTEGESLDDVRRTLDFVDELDPFAVILMVWVDDYEALDPVYSAERRRFRERVHEVLGQRAGERPRWIVPPLGIHFGERLFQTLRRLGCEGPLWQYIDRIAAA